MSSYLYWTMASIIWALPLLAQLHILLYTATAHVHAGNLTRHSVPFLCRPDQAEALLQLKESFFLDVSTTRLPSWRDNTDCCLWEGVGCDVSTGNVTVLDLNNRGLSSYGLDPVIFNLTSLRRLDLSMNDFSRRNLFCFDIPATGFERLTLLTHLNLSHSEFNGQIPIGIGKLVNLISLDLSSSIGHIPENTFGNCLGPFESNLSGALLANLSNLRELYLDGVDLSSSGEGWSKVLASSVPCLQVLSLAHCYLSGRIDKSLSRLRALSAINFQGNYAMAAGPFPEFIMDFLNLTMLQLSGTNLKGLFPSRPFRSKDLRVLDLSYNDLSGHMPNLSGASSLETLRLHGTNFSFAKQMSSSSFKVLKELGLDGNLASVDFLSSLGKLGSVQQLNIVGFDSIIEPGPIFSWIGDHKTLRSLVLMNCNLSVVLPSLVSNLMTLRSLTMFDCNVPSAFFYSLGSLINLQTLIMKECRSDGPLPSSIGNLTNLRNIVITNNRLRFSGPTAIGNLTNLKTMRVYNDFAGAIPYEFGKLKELTSLVLLFCNFSGSIPNSLGNLTQLTILDLSYNSLSGEIPSSIFTLPMLHELDLSCNLLSGPIREFDNLSSLLELVNLNTNQLSGSIPNAFFRLTSLIYLDISSNNLIGSVDLTSFWRLRWLSGLSLSSNKLSVMEGGDINPLTTNISGLTSLDLASCNMGRFPDSLALMSRVSYLDLSCNRIIGDVPKWIWESWANSLSYLNISHNLLTNMQLNSDILPFTNALQALDLSFNELQGPIPLPESSSWILDYSNNRFTSVHPNLAYYATKTWYLSMSNNSINGHIPLSICNSTVSVLDLSHNNFSGMIPSCIIENGQLEVLNLRENQFEGTLPTNIATGCFSHTIDLHGNKIFGQLPRGLSNCPQLEVLDFGSNRILDTFPSWLRGLPRLSVIVLRSNNFYGTIGDAVGHIKYEEFFPSLKILDLSSNNFSGNLRPQWIERLKSMMTKFNSTGEIIAALNYTESTELYQDSVQIMYKGSYVTINRILTTLTVIDFSNNRLVGNIPESIRRLVSLHLLNLSHNAFTGQIPAQLGDMTDLESLDLSGNQLSGVIPEALTNLTFLGFLNLSNNRLVGKIPQSHQFSTFGSSSFKGNPGLCGLPLNPCSASPYNTDGRYEKKSSRHHVDVILFLFVGLGFGVGFAAAILLKWSQVSRWFNATRRSWRT